jgi:hypothetical protein
MGKAMLVFSAGTRTCIGRHVSVANHISMQYRID